MPLVASQMPRGMFASTTTIHNSTERFNVSKVTGSFKNALAVTRLETYQNRYATHAMVCVDAQRVLGVVVVSRPIVGGLKGFIL